MELISLWLLFHVLEISELHEYDLPSVYSLESNAMNPEERDMSSESEYFSRDSSFDAPFFAGKDEGRMLASRQIRAMGVWAAQHFYIAPAGKMYLRSSHSLFFLIWESRFLCSIIGTHQKYFSLFGELGEEPCAYL